MAAIVLTNRDFDPNVLCGTLKQLVGFEVRVLTRSNIMFEGTYVNMTTKNQIWLKFACQVDIHNPRERGHLVQTLMISISACQSILPKTGGGRNELFGVRFQGPPPCNIESKQKVQTTPNKNTEAAALPERTYLTTPNNLVSGVSPTAWLELVSKGHMEYKEELEQPQPEFAARNSANIIFPPSMFSYPPPPLPPKPLRNFMPPAGLQANDNFRLTSNRMPYQRPVYINAAGNNTNYTYMPPTRFAVPMSANTPNFNMPPHPFCMPPPTDMKNMRSSCYFTGVPLRATAPNCVPPNIQMPQPQATVPPQNMAPPNVGLNHCHPYLASCLQQIVIQMTQLLTTNYINNLNAKQTPYETMPPQQPAPAPQAAAAAAAASTSATTANNVDERIPEWTKSRRFWDVESIEDYRANRNARFYANNYAQNGMPSGDKASAAAYLRNLAQQTAATQANNSVQGCNISSYNNILTGNVNAFKLYDPNRAEPQSLAEARAMMQALNEATAYYRNLSASIMARHINAPPGFGPQNLNVSACKQ